MRSELLIVFLIVIVRLNPKLLASISNLLPPVAAS